jgi:hypothetical protein
MTAFTIFTRNQLLYVEAGIVFVLLSMIVSRGLLIVGPFTLVFAPIALLLSPIYLWIFATLCLLGAKAQSEDVELELLFCKENLPRPTRMVTFTALSVFLAIVELAVIVDMGHHLTFIFRFMLVQLLIIQNMVLCLIMLKLTKHSGRGLLFASLSLPLLFITLVLGGVLAIPLLFISLFKSADWSELPGAQPSGSRSSVLLAGCDGK